MSVHRRPLLSPGALLRELVFIVRMRASERRFRRHHESWRRHQVATNKRSDAMVAEIELRAMLCERNAAARVEGLGRRTASAAPVAGSRRGSVRVLLEDQADEPPERP